MSSRPWRLAIVSDIHYAGEAERRRAGYNLSYVRNPLRRAALAAYRHVVWQRDPFAHNHLLDRFLAHAAQADFVVANGDYSCDSAFIGVSDDASHDSAAECLDKLRRHCAPRFQATVGDHELGKKPLGADVGGLRLESFRRTAKSLALKPFWTITHGAYVLIGVTSSLIALPVYAAECLAEERAEWARLRAAHLAEVRAVFDALEPRQRAVLFCHDPTALPFLWAEDAVRRKSAQIEKTVIGHLHSRLVFRASRVLTGMPVIGFLGHTPKRLSAALRDARCWRHFNVLFCPSLQGIELVKDGGYFTAELDPDARQPAVFQFHALRR